MVDFLSWLEHVLRDYWPALIATVILFKALRIAKTAVDIWLGIDRPEQAEAEEEKPEPPNAVRGSISGAVFKWLVLAVLVASGAGYALYSSLNRPGLPEISKFTTAELLDLIKIGLAVIGGLGAVVALAVAHRKQQVSEAAHKIASNQELREETKYFNERYVKAAEQLGHERFAVRLAGVYAMASLAEDWPEQRQTCVDVLCGYLRTPYPEDDFTEREVRQEIISTLLDRSWQEDPRNKIRMDFRKVQFEDLDLSRRTFSGDLNFEYAVFRGKVTSFHDCTFIGKMNFEGATFQSEHTYFTEARMKNATLDFTAAKFTHSSLTFTASMLHSKSTINLQYADLTNTNIDLSSMLVRSSQINFEGIDAHGSVISFEGTSLTSAALFASHASFNDSTLVTTGVTWYDLTLSAEHVQPEKAMNQFQELGRAAVPRETPQPFQFVRPQSVRMRRVQ
jgi:uncharacterized protein YjbI with pentapeptide repeats